MSLKEYKKKRRFKSTPEPIGDLELTTQVHLDSSKSKKNPSTPPKNDAYRFTIQLHSASKLHYDLRLEANGVMKSWAVPKGPSLDPLERRLAVEVEDHPIEYNEFEGVIPPGNYGAGTVMIWDEGTFELRSKNIRKGSFDHDAFFLKFQKNGHITFILSGIKLKGEFALIRLKNNEKSQKNWILVKKHDLYMSRKDITSQQYSVRTGRNLNQIAVDSQNNQVYWSGTAQKKSSQKNNSKSPRGAVPKILSELLSRNPDLLPVQPESSEKYLGVAHIEPLDVWRGKQIRGDFSERKAYQAFYAGYRARLIVNNKGDLKLLGKGGHLINQRFGDLCATLRTETQNMLKRKNFFGSNQSFTLCGLIVPLDGSGHPRPLGKNLGLKPHYAFYVYDLIEWCGYRLGDLPLIDRMFLLESMKFGSENLKKILPIKKEYLIDSEMEENKLWLIRDFYLPAHPKNLSGTLYESAMTPKENKSEGTTPKRHDANNVQLESIHRVIATTHSRSPRRLIESNTKKIFWPEEGFTKGDLLRYYKNVMPYILPHIIDRPQSLNRHPNGILGKSFFQKEVAGHLPSWMATATISSSRSGKSVTYGVVKHPEDLLFLVNLGCIEINTWLSKIQSINQPDYIVFDLDPGQVAFSVVVDVALRLKRILSRLEVPFYLKTSGGRGLHIYVPTLDCPSFAFARKFAENISLKVHAELPKWTSLERMPAKRVNQVYLDCLQNRIGQTMASVYSVRPRTGAYVSAPISWYELEQGAKPADFNLRSMENRLIKFGDLWAATLNDNEKISYSKLVSLLKSNLS